MTQQTQDRAQLSLFAPETRSNERRMPSGYYRALDQDVLKEALDIYRQHASRFSSGRIFEGLAKKHNLGGYWTGTVHKLESLGFLDRMNCYYGSDTPCDKTREYLGYLPFYKIKKEFLK